MRKATDPMDVLDHIEAYTTEMLESVKEPLTPKAALDIFKSALQKARANSPRTCYIRDHNQRELDIFHLWEQLKHGSMNMKEIYEHISQQTNAPASTAEKYITKFRRGYDPTKPKFETAF